MIILRQEKIPFFFRGGLCLPRLRHQRSEIDNHPFLQIGGNMDQLYENGITHSLGYGIHLRDPETFIRRVIKKICWIYSIPYSTNCKDMMGVGRVTLFEIDHKFITNGLIPKLSNYWWAVSKDIGIAFGEMGYPNMFYQKHCHQMVSLEGSLLLHSLKQYREPNPSIEVEKKDCINKIKALLAINSAGRRGREQDVLIFELMLRGLTAKEISMRPEVVSKNRIVIKDSLKRSLQCIEKSLGVNLKPYGIYISEFSKERTTEEVKERNRRIDRIRKRLYREKKSQEIARA